MRDLFATSFAVASKEVNKKVRIFCPLAIRLQRDRAMSSVGYNNQTLTPTWIKEFPVIGKGIVVFNVIRATDFAIAVRPKDKHDGNWKPWQWIAVYITSNKALFLLGQESGGCKVLAETTAEGVGFEPDSIISYWLSYDRDRMVVKYGKGYYMEETTLLRYAFLEGKTEEEAKQIRTDLQYLFGPVGVKEILFFDVAVLKELAKIYASKHRKLSKLLSVIEETDSEKGTVPEVANHPHVESLVDVESKVLFDRCPLVKNWPPFVIDSSQLTLFYLDSNEYTFSASLPRACRELYENVALSKNVDLDWPTVPGQPKLTDAIRYSIITPGKILYKKLKEKASEFGDDPHMCYLRVTLGRTRGDSPGVPYVLEIWPFGNYSPKHNHGNAHAVIRVMHGSLNVKIFNKPLDRDLKPLKVITISKGDVTWISPNWYQTHQLVNDVSGDYCATIQCYKYGDDDEIQWPYFDYLDENRAIGEFLPNSDFEFTKLREDLLKEYIARLDSEAAKY